LGSSGLILTDRFGRPKDLASVLRADFFPSEFSDEGPFYLILTAGGDGTSRDVLQALYEMPRMQNQGAVLRLPLGTGNDGADAWELDRALELLLYPSKLELSRAVRLTTARGRGPFYAFNILSLGLDAFVTHMTNKIKSFFPGDLYKLWVDLAALFYDRFYRPGPMGVCAFDDEGNPVKLFRESLLLLAMGVTGGRTYGSHRRILPDERNVCALKQMPLFRKWALKKSIDAGSHALAPEALLFSAHRIELRGDHRILAQMDGETISLTPEDFPAVLELTEPALPILKPGTSI
jgi:diacylglycerol kinase family enzyme